MRLMLGIRIARGVLRMTNSATTVRSFTVR
jgi:hypothetical protein